MKNKSKPTAEVVLFSSRTVFGNKHPIRLRITYLRTQKYYSLQLSVTKEEWENILNYNKLKSKSLKETLYDTYTTIRESEKKAKKIIENHEDEGIPFSFQQFEQDYFEPKSKSVIEFIEKLNEKLLQKEQYGNYRIYKNLLDSLKKYSNEKNVTFNQITTHFLKDYENFLSKPIENKKNGKTSISRTTISIRLRTLRAVFNEAISQNLVKQEQYPFKAFKIRGGTAQKRALHKSQVLLIFNFNPESNSPQWYSKTYFIFSYLCQGINFGDLAMLKWENIIEDRIEYQRKKTINTLKNPKVISIKISDEINSILSLFKNSSKKKKDYIFPIIDKELSGKQLRDYILDKNKKHNEALKEIGKELQIDLTLTSYVARHSYATVLKRSNVPTSVISESLGHSSESVTQNYLDSFENSVIDDANKNLL